MSVEEDTELRDLVAQTLETNGVLNKIRAELRANVFLALEEQEVLKKKTVSNKALKNFLDTKEGQLMFSVVREFLEFFNLEFTLAVLDPESDFANRSSPRENLINEFNMQTVDPKAPLLSELLRQKTEECTSPNLPRVSKIPQRVQRSPVSDSKPKDPTDKRMALSPEDIDTDDDIFKELGVSPTGTYNTQSNNNATNKKKPAWLSSEPSPSKSGEKSSTKFHENNKSPSLNLGSLKDAPPLPGVANKNKSSTNDSPLDVTSPEWDDLLKIDKKITDLGFDIPKSDKDTSDKSTTKDKKSSQKDSEFNYEDDFVASSSQKSNGLSITEEIEEDLSIGSFAASKNDELQTTDHTVSQMSDPDIDYGEDAEFY